MNINHAWLSLYCKLRQVLMGLKILKNKGTAPRLRSSYHPIDLMTSGIGFLVDYD